MADEDGTTEEPEEWRWIPGYEGQYQASSHGRIRSVDRRGPHQNQAIKGKLRKQWRAKTGYLYVQLCHRGAVRCHKVHRLILLSFAGESPAGRPACRHLDGKRGNNERRNLAWGSAKENAADRERHGTILRGEAIGTSKLNRAAVLEARRRRAEGEKLSVIAAHFAVDEKTIALIVKGKTWRSVLPEDPSPLPPP